MIALLTVVRVLENHDGVVDGILHLLNYYYHRLPALLMSLSKVRLDE